MAIMTIRCLQNDVNLKEILNFQLINIDKIIIKRQIHVLSVENSKKIKNRITHVHIVIHSCDFLTSKNFTFSFSFSNFFLFYCFFSTSQLIQFCLRLLKIFQPFLVSFL